MTRKFKLNYLWASLLLFASCAQDDPTGGNGTPLPEGLYPLQVKSVSLSAEGGGTPLSRVTEIENGNGSAFENGDRINVRIGNGTPGVYLIDRFITAETPAYWIEAGPTEQAITAWYPANGAISLADQSKKLAYVLRAETRALFLNQVNLNFSHSLSKIRVKIVGGNKAGEVNNVSIEALTSCTNTDGVVSNALILAEIKMLKAENEGVLFFEANVVPGHQITRIKVNGGDWTTIDTPITPVAGKVHEIAVMVEEPKIDVSEISETEYTVSGYVYLKGDKTPKNLRLVMEDGAELVLENVNLAPQTKGDVIACKGNATITLRGENTLIAYQTQDFAPNSSAIEVRAGTLTINGTDDTKLTAKSDPGVGNGDTGIAALNGANIVINGGHIVVNQNVAGEGAGIGPVPWNPGGDITINGGIIEAWGGSYAAGIGGSNSGSCGNITITGGNITAYGGLRTPGIGNGDDASCGNITISGANTVIYAKKGPNCANSIGHNGYNGRCGTVTIGPECTVRQE